MAMKSSKAELMGRLRKEGRWVDAERVKNEMIAEARKDKPNGKKGLSHAAAQAWAWEQLEKMYPPLPPEQMPSKPPAPGTVVPSGNERSTREVVLELFGELPASAPYDVEVGWAHQNRILVIEERTGMATRMVWKHCQSPPPSWGAVGWLELAASNKAKFMEIVQKVQASGEDEDEEGVRREKKSIVEIKGILERLRETK